MTEPTGLEWLAEGATAAYIYGGVHNQRVSDAVVQKIGKRDVVVVVNGRTEKFNINRTWRRGEWTQLRRSGNSTWDAGVELAAADDPAVAELRTRQTRDDAASDVVAAADRFRSSRDVENAKKLRAAIDAFLDLHDRDDDAGSVT
ncbi:hypothetical protein [Nocardia otitidiscaviarum]|uniref:hypothetical protein n=1 Tax=Nocardia otitidiscaviarum TaxID=1823 RepID=UPI0004A6ECA1|nr:hypothetical protein [Nocardia otitidiscaviarum]